MEVSTRDVNGVFFFYPPNRNRRLLCGWGLMGFCYRCCEPVKTLRRRRRRMGSGDSNRRRTCIAALDGVACAAPADRDGNEERPEPRMCRKAGRGVPCAAPADGNGRRSGPSWSLDGGWGGGRSTGTSSSFSLRQASWQFHGAGDDSQIRVLQLAYGCRGGGPRSDDCAAGRGRLPPWKTRTHGGTMRGNNSSPLHVLHRFHRNWCVCSQHVRSYSSLDIAQIPHPGTHSAYHFGSIWS
jgi:hypothetical protein